MVKLSKISALIYILMCQKNVASPYIKLLPKLIPLLLLLELMATRADLVRLSNCCCGS